MTKRTSQLLPGDKICGRTIARVQSIGSVDTPNGQSIECFEIIFTDGKSRVARDAVNWTLENA